MVVLSSVALAWLTASAMLLPVLGRLIRAASPPAPSPAAAPAQDDRPALRLVADPRG